MAKRKTLSIAILAIIIAGIGVLVCSIEKHSDMGKYRRAQKENTMSGYVTYLEAYPYGKNASQAVDAICEIISASSFEYLKSIHYIVDGWSHIPNNELHNRCHNAIKDLAEQAYDAAMRENTVEAWDYFIKYVPGDYIKDANTKRVDAAYTDAVKANTIESWNTYKNIVGVCNYRDADERIAEIDSKQWKNESNAWHLATSDGTISAYNKYLKFHPNGTHSHKARKNVIDLRVDSIFAGSHGTLPPMDHSYYGSSPTSSIQIHNGTGYKLTIYYSGKTSKRIIIPADQSTTFNLPNGDYRVAASVSNASVRSYAGREFLAGGGYEADYYISTYRY